MICLDPGHGGDDTGTTYQDYKEKNIVLEICKVLESFLIHDDIEYVTTRSTDSTLELLDRTGKAGMYDADIFVSIHTDFFPSSGAQGSTLIHYPGSEEGEKLAGCIKKQMESLNIQSRDTRTNENFVVLNSTSCPAVIVECGFLSNEGDRRILTSHSGVYEIAYRIYEGITDYLHSATD